jgi:hypothetical protein
LALGIPSCGAGAFPGWGTGAAGKLLAPLELVPIHRPAASTLRRKRILEVDEESMENLQCLSSRSFVVDDCVLKDQKVRLLPAAAGGIATIRSKAVMEKRD